MQKLDYRLECLYDFVKHNKEFTLKQVSDELLLSEAHLLKLIKVLAVKNNMNIYREKKDNEIFYSLYENQVLKNQKLKEIRKVFKTNFGLKAFQSMSNSDVERIYQIVERHKKKNLEYFETGD